MIAAPMPRGQGRRARIALIAAIAAVYAGGLIGGHWISTHTEAWLVQQGVSPENPALAGVLIGVICLYIVATALPFVPGVEIGLGLIMLFGGRIVPLVYLATVAALVLAFAVGRTVPQDRLVRLFSGLGLDRTSALLRGLSGLTEAERIERLLAIAPEGCASWLLRHRFWGLALLINVPGNALVGGGGGIAVAVGLSRLISFPMYILCVMLAVSPIPISVLVFGWFAQ